MSWNDFKPEIMEEKENDNVFGPVNGKYVAQVIDFGRKCGTGQDSGKPYDLITLKFNVIETVKGDNANKRRFDRTFFLQDGEYGTKDDALQSLCNTVFTITKQELDLKITDEDDFEQRVAKVIRACDGVIGKDANLTIYPKKDKATKKIKLDKNGNAQHTVLVVAEHKVKGRKNPISTEEVPF